MTPDETDRLRIKPHVPPDDAKVCRHPHFLDAPFTDDDLLRAHYVLAAAFARDDVDVPLDITTVRSAGRVFAVLPLGDTRELRPFIRVGLFKVVLPAQPAAEGQESTDRPTGETTT